MWINTDYRLWYESCFCEWECNSLWFLLLLLIFFALWIFIFNTIYTRNMHKPRHAPYHYHHPSPTPGHAPYHHHHSPTPGHAPYHHHHSPTPGHAPYHHSPLSPPPWHAPYHLFCCCNNTATGLFSKEIFLFDLFRLNSSQTQFLYWSVQKL